MHHPLSRRLHCFHRSAWHGRAGKGTRPPARSSYFPTEKYKAEVRRRTWNVREVQISTATSSIRPTDGSSHSRSLCADPQGQHLRFSNAFR